MPSVSGTGGPSDATTTFSASRGSSGDWARIASAMCWARWVSVSLLSPVLAARTNAARLNPGTWGCSDSAISATARLFSTSPSTEPLAIEEGAVKRS